VLVYDLNCSRYIINISILTIITTSIDIHLLIIFEGIHSCIVVCNGNRVDMVTNMDLKIVE